MNVQHPLELKLKYKQIIHGSVHFSSLLKVFAGIQSLDRM